MKSKDLTMLVVIGVVSAVISIILSNIFLAPADDRKQQVEVVAPIQAELDRPPAEYFNENSLNPTKTIQIGEEPNSNPFSGQ